MEDSLIIALFLRRNEDAIKLTSQKYSKRIRGVISKIIYDYETMEECENDTYLESWNRIPPSEPREYFPAFLSAIARHLSIDRVRRDNSKCRKAELIELSNELEQIFPSSMDVESEVEGKLLIESINDYLLKLPKYKRMVFVKRYFYMVSISEISMESGYSKSKVKSILHKIRLDLHKFLSEEMGYDF